MSDFLKHEDDEELLRQLASIMTRVEFSQSEKLYLPENNVFFLVQSGRIRVLDTELQAGDCFGAREQSNAPFSIHEVPALCSLYPAVLGSNLSAGKMNPT